MEIIIKFCLFYPNTGFWKLIFRQVVALKKKFEHKHAENRIKRKKFFTKK